MDTTPKTTLNPMERMLGIEDQVEEQIQVERKANKEALIEANYDNTPIIKHIKQCQTRTMTLTHNFLHLIQWRQHLW